MTKDEIQGRYTLVAKLGAGAFGEVWRAWDKQLERDVALKFMRRELAATPFLRRRFEREPRAQARLSHPNVVQVFDNGTWEDQPFIVMEFVKGRSLRARLDEVLGDGQLLPRDEARAVFLQVCAGIAAAHRASIIHRDIKPENVIVEAETDPPSVKVLDFGLARLDHGQSSIALTVGTPAYMSPEQGSDADAELTAASDVFALGVLLIELLTGQCFPEAPRKTPWERLVLLGQSDARIAALESTCPDVPPAVWEVARRAMLRDPSARFANAAELARALESAWPLAASLPSLLPPPASLPTPSNTPAVSRHLPSGVTLPSIALPPETPLAVVPSDAPRSPGQGTATPSPTAVSAGRTRRWVIASGAVIVASVLSGVAMLAVTRRPSTPVTAIQSQAPEAVLRADANTGPSQTRPGDPGGSPGTVLVRAAQQANARVTPVVRQTGASALGWARRHAPPTRNGPAPGPAPGMDAAQACFRTGSVGVVLNRCVVDALRDRANSEPELRLLCITYRQMGDRANAAACMRRYVQAYPSTRYTDQFNEYIAGG